LFKGGFRNDFGRPGRRLGLQDAAGK